MRTHALRRAGGAFPSFRCIRFGNLPQETRDKNNEARQRKIRGTLSNRLLEIDARPQEYDREQFTT